MIMIINLLKSVFKRHHSNKHFSEFYPQHDSENQLA